MIIVYIYSIINLLNGKIYIGKTNNIKKRWNDHLNLSKKSSDERHHLIHKAINKYDASNFQFSIVQELYSEIEANKCEQYWINYYQTYVLKFGNEFGYNLTPGGEGMQIGTQTGEQNHNHKLTKQQVQLIKISKLKTKELVAQFSVSRTTIQRIRSGKIWGELNTPENKNKSISKLDLEKANNIRILFNSSNVTATSISKKYNISQSLCYMIINNKIWIDNNYFISDLAKEKLSINHFGENNPNAKLSSNDVIAIREAHSNGVSRLHLSQQYNVTIDYVKKILTKERWKHI